MTLTSFAHAMALRLLADGPDGPVFAVPTRTGRSGPRSTAGDGRVVRQGATAAIKDTAPTNSRWWFRRLPRRPGPGRGVAGDRRPQTRPSDRRRRRRTRSGGRTAVRATVTVGAAESRAELLLVDNPVVAVMAPEPPDGLEAIGPGHPMAEINHLAAG